MFWITIGFIFCLVIGFVIGLLVGRNNPKVADRASSLADSAVEKAREVKDKLGDKGHGYINFIPVVWIVLAISGLAWFALSGWIVFLIRLLMGR